MNQLKVLIRYKRLSPVNSISISKYSSDDTKKLDQSVLNKEKDIDEAKMPEIPVNCCGTGCQNCVWLQYADQLLDYYNKKQAKTIQNANVALDEIEKLNDENLKAYLSMELKNKFKDLVDK